MAAGRLSDPRAVDYLVKTLLERRGKLARTFLARVSPLDEFGVHEGSLCFTDLARRHGFAAARDTVYAWRTLDDHGRVLGQGHTSDESIPMQRGGYRIVEVRAGYAGAARPAVRVHIGLSGRVVGVERDGT